jgi:hypothetical protein
MKYRDVSPTDPDPTDQDMRGTSPEDSDPPPLPQTK